MAIQVAPTVSPRIITVPEADGDSITIQSLVNQIRNWEDNQANLTYTKLLSASGKENLGSGTLVGITAKLENAKVKFADRGSPTVCTISGGNLVAVDSNGASIFPIETSTNVTVMLSQSSSATIASGTSDWSQAEKDDILAKTQEIENRIGIPTSPTIADDLDEIESHVIATSDKIETIKGTGWTDETLKKIKELIAGIQVAPGGGFSL